MQPDEFLKSEYLKRRQKNERYSLRSFARDLGVSHTLISKIFSGHRALTSKQAVKISALLGLSDRTTKTLLRAISGLNTTENLTEKKQFQDLQVDHEAMVSRWFHQVILEMTFLKNFKNEPGWIAKTLGITSLEVRDAIERLKKLELLEEVNQTLKKANGMLCFRTSRSTGALRAYYIATLEKAKDELKNVSNSAFQSRYIAGGTVAIKKEKVPLAIQRLKEMQNDFVSEFASEDADDVYQFGTQFFSLLKKGDQKC